PFRLFFGLVQLAFDSLAVCRIADRSHRDRPLVGFQWAEANLQWKFLPILTLSGQLKPGPHRLASWIFEKVSSVPRMLAAKAFRNEDVDVFPEQFVALIAEDFFRLRIHQHDRAVAFYDDDGVGGGFQKSFEFLIGFTALGDVLGGPNNPDDFAGVIEHGSTKRMQESGFAIRQNNAHFYPGGFLAGGQFPQPLARRFAILLLNGRHETLITGQEFVRPESKQPILFLRPKDLPRGDVPFPASDMSDALCFAQARFAELESILGLFAPCNVSQNSGVKLALVGFPAR